MAALKDTRTDFVRALKMNAQHPPAFSFLGKEFWVDQRRKIVTLPDNPDYWKKEGGSWYVSNETPPACLFLSSVIGTTRYLSVSGFVTIVTRLCEGEPWRAASESGTANFLNLAVSEGVALPRRNLMLWATVAHELAAGREETNLHSILPTLITDHDALSLPENPRILFSEKLMSSGSVAFEGTDKEYENQLVRAIEVEQAERTTGFQDSSIESSPDARPDREFLSAYIRNHVFTRVASALGAPR
ncbi:hypothetical protein ACWD7Y_15300 [Streptomyces drozdowiczii]